MPALLLRGVRVSNNIKGVLFDKDGTLCNSEDYLLNLANSRIKEAKKFIQKKYKSQDKAGEIEQLLSISYGITRHGLRPNGIIAVASRADNLISTATIFCAIGENWPNAISISNKIFQRVDQSEKNFANVTNSRTLLPGAIRLLNRLQQAEIVCALISNDTHSGIQSFLRSHKLENKFKNFWSAENYPSKPNPSAVKAFCNLLGLNPEHCALIGDSDTDMRMARQAGIGLRLGYTSGWNQSPELTEHQEIIQHWDDLTVE